MRKLAIAVVAASSMAVLAGCTTGQGALGGALLGGAVGGLATNNVGGAIVGAGVGALAGAILVETHNNGWCTYKYNGQFYRERCRR